MAGANYMGGKRNAMKARTRDTIGRKQKMFFGRQRLDMLAKGISTTSQPNKTRSALGGKGPEDIALAHARRKNTRSDEDDAAIKNFIPSPVRFSSSAVGSKRRILDAHTSSSGRSEILDKLDVSEPLFLRQAMDRILARPDLACLGKRKSRTYLSTSSQPELSSNKQREQKEITVLAKEVRKVDEPGTGCTHKNQQPHTPPNKKQKVQVKQLSPEFIREGSFSPIESIEDFSDWKSSSEYEENDSGYAGHFEEKDQALSSDSWSVRYHSSSTRGRNVRMAKTPEFSRNSTLEYDSDNGSYQAISQIQAHEEQYLDDAVPLTINFGGVTDGQKIGRGMQQRAGSVYGSLFAKPDPWKVIGIILGLEGAAMQDKEAVVHQRTSGNSGSTGLEELGNDPHLRQSDEEDKSSCVVQADAFSDGVTSLRLDTRNLNTSLESGGTSFRLHQSEILRSDISMTFSEKKFGSKKRCRLQHSSIEDDPGGNSHQNSDIANHGERLGDNDRSENPGSERSIAERRQDYIHDLEEINKSEVLAVPGFQEVDGRFLAPAIFDNWNNERHSFRSVYTVMSLSTQSATSNGKSIAASALRGAGLIDRDSTMRDATDTAGGRKGRIRSTRATRLLDTNKDRPLGTRTHQIRVSTSTHAGHSDPLSIRGAGRPTVAGRLRRNAISGTSESSSSSRIPVRIAPSKPVESWREFVQKRWNPETRYLNLDSMIDDETVKKYNLSPPGHGGTARDAAVIFKLASQLKPEVQTLSLANNNLTGAFLMQLSKYLPNLVNLSLQNNLIRDKKEMAMIVPRKDKMIHLRELVLLGNPLREAAYKTGAGDVYRAEISRRFTSLEVLDQEPITQISFDAPKPSASISAVDKPSATSFPYSMDTSFVTGVDGALVSNFLIRYFQAFDTQRELLVNVYDTSATFSFSANTSIPIRARISGFHSSRDMPNQRKLEWGIWLEAGSRNLNRIASDPQKTLNNLHIGGESIVKALSVLPPTRHDINGPPEKFCLDAFPVPHGQSMGLLVTLHGQFAEVASGGVRSFDRTWMLVPAAAGSQAKLNGWDVSILSDQWLVRSYSSNEAWKPGPLLVQAASGQSKQNTVQNQPLLQNFSIASLPPDQQVALGLLPELQRNLVIQLCAATGLNAKFAHDCLAGNDFDFQRAITNFNAVKASLSREAFL